MPLSVSLRLEPFAPTLPPSFMSELVSLSSFASFARAGTKTAPLAPSIQTCSTKYWHFACTVLPFCMTQLLQVVCQGLLSGCLPDIPPFGSVTHRLRLLSPFLPILCLAQFRFPSIPQCRVPRTWHLQVPSPHPHHIWSGHQPHHPPLSACRFAISVFHTPTNRTFTAPPLTIEAARA